jgi:hypothetical protein
LYRVFFLIISNRNSVNVENESPQASNNQSAKKYYHENAQDDISGTQFQYKPNIYISKDQSHAENGGKNSYGATAKRSQISGKSNCVSVSKRNPKEQINLYRRAERERVFSDNFDSGNDNPGPGAYEVGRGFGNISGKGYKFSDTPNKKSKR